MVRGFPSDSHCQVSEEIPPLPEQARLKRVFSRLSRVLFPVLVEPQKNTALESKILRLTKLAVISSRKFINSGEPPVKLTLAL